MSDTVQEATTSTVNPFTPVFGKIPSYMAGREQIIEDMLLAFDNGAGDPNLSSIFVGARGTGKTALLSFLATKAAQRDWIAASVTAVPGMLEDIIQRISETAPHLLETKPTRKLTSVGIAPLGSVTWENLSESSLNWRSKMNLLFDQLARTNTGILITVDEVNPALEEMIQLATVYQHFVRENKKVALLMAGLPHNVTTLLSGQTTSFLRRAFRHDLGSIPNYEIEQAFRIVIERAGKTIDTDALQLAVEATDGFPFMFQLVGYRMWALSQEKESITLDDVRMGARIAKEELKRQVYDATYAELSNGDIEFLRAMLVDERSSRIADVAKRLGKSSGHISTYKRRLLKSGVVEEGLRGELRFCLPGFKEYLSEIYG